MNLGQKMEFFRADRHPEEIKTTHSWIDTQSVFKQYKASSINLQPPLKRLNKGP